MYLLFNFSVLFKYFNALGKKTFKSYIKLHIPIWYTNLSRVFSLPYSRNKIKIKQI